MITNYERTVNSLKKLKFSILALLICVLLSIGGCKETLGRLPDGQAATETTSNQTDLKPIDTDTDNKATPTNQTTPTNSIPLNIYFIDVGQADACLLEYDGHFMLIDAGNNSDETSIVKFLDVHGVKTLDYVIGTHPHADHIGGMDAVIKNFDIEKIFMPKVQADTQTFEDVLIAMEQKGLSVNTPIAGNEFLFNGIQIQILAPVKNYEDINNNSIVLKLTYGDISCLFTGDIEADAETDILHESDISADIIKLAHHGSDTSSTTTFMKAVNPQFAIISVGENNTYGHPNEMVLNQLTNQGIQSYRTDKSGTIKITTNGETIDINFEENTSSILQDGNVEQTRIDESSEYVPEISADTKYIGNRKSKKIHLSSCGNLPAEKNRVIFDTKDDAVGSGYVPCKNCNP